MRSPLMTATNKAVTMRANLSMFRLVHASPSYTPIKSTVRDLLPFSGIDESLNKVRAELVFEHCVHRSHRSLERLFVGVGDLNPEFHQFINLLGFHLARDVPL